MRSILVKYIISVLVFLSVTGFNTLQSPIVYRSADFCRKDWNYNALPYEEVENEFYYINTGAMLQGSLLTTNYPDTLDRSFFDRHDGCNGFKQSFASSDAAIRYARSFNFHFTDYVLITNSSSLKKAEWYSCSGQKGYCIFTSITGKEVIHRGVPIEVWRGFKNSLVKGPYYDYNIKGRYAFS